MSADLVSNQHITAIPESATPTPAEIEYRNLYAEVCDLMALAAELVDDHAIRVLEDASAAPDWEHVGDMRHVRQIVKQLVDFLSDDDI